MTAKRKQYLRMKLALWAAMLLAVGSIALATYAAMPPDYNAMLRSTVTVESELGSCSGFTVRRNNNWYIWTAAHCVSDESGASTDVRHLFGYIPYLESDPLIHDFIVVDEYGFPYKAKLVARLTDVDAALLRLVPGSSGMSFRDTRFGVAEQRMMQIILAGSPLREANTITSGHVARFNDEWFFGYTDVGDMRAQPGNSGGPVFDRSGRVVGILVGIRGSIFSDKLAEYVPTRELRARATEQGLAWAL